MEFHIALTDGPADPNVIQDALFDIDTTAVVDLDMSGWVLRVSSSATAADVIRGDRVGSGTGAGGAFGIDLLRWLRRVKRDANW